MKYLLILLLVSQVLYSKPKHYSRIVTTPRFAIFKSDPYFRRFVPIKSFSIQTGGSGYFGDIAPFKVYGTTAIKSIRPNLGLEYAHKFKKNLSYRINLNWIQIAASDKYYDSCSSYTANFIRGASFTTNMFEYTTSFQYDMPINKVIPYVFVGFGGFVYKKPSDNQMDASISFPVGVGIKTKLNSHFDIGTELNYRYTFTDKLDGITDDVKYTGSNSPSIMLGPDLFYTVQIKLTYHFLVDTNCSR